jgi:outer membrane protein
MHIKRQKSFEEYCLLKLAIWFAIIIMGLGGTTLKGQAIGTGAPSTSVTVANDRQAQASDAKTKLSLADAIKRAQALSPDLQIAVTDVETTKQAKTIARSALLPTVSYNNQYIYTQGGRFIASNGVHEYISQGNAHEVISLAQFAEYRRTNSAAASARARATIASVGLVLAVVQNYFGYAAAQQKLSAAVEAADTADRYVVLSSQLEQGGEVARADVIKARIEANDRRRDLADAASTALKAKLDLFILLTRSSNEDFELTDSLDTLPSLPTLPEIRDLASRNNPDIAAAQSFTREANAELLTSKAGFVPALTLDYFYGIDASHFATHTDGIRNLGYATVATLQIPVWDWGATWARVKQSKSKVKLADVQLSFAQQKLRNDIESHYDEAKTALSDLQLLRETVHMGEESLQLTEMRYRAGEATALELVDAQNSLTTARFAYSDGEVRYHVALASLQALTGTF